jgi:hypothetical protein
MVKSSNRGGRSGGAGVRFAARCTVLLGLFGMAGAALPAAAAEQAPESFASPEQAVAAMIAASRAEQPDALVRILGSAGEELVNSGDAVADREARERFVASYDKANKLLREGDHKAIIEIGPEEWPLPIPLVEQGGAWHFDTAAGAQEILDRRVGRNELNAIAVCRAYVSAQRDYAAERAGGHGLLEYAQKFKSSPGQRDGLYWPVRPGETDSPLGPLIASARAEGYAGERRGEHNPYHGYYYKILTRQGGSTPGGAYDYVVDGHMIGGFGLVAFPARYGDSGIMTFIVNQDGIVYEKDLGPETGSIARSMAEFDPDPSWKKP